MRVRVRVRIQERLFIGTSLWKGWEKRVRYQRGTLYIWWPFAYNMNFTLLFSSFSATSMLRYLRREVRGECGER